MDDTTAARLIADQADRLSGVGEHDLLRELAFQLASALAATSGAERPGMFAARELQRLAREASDFLGDDYAS
jgi:hypothetical protein